MLPTPPRRGAHAGPVRSPRARRTVRWYAAATSVVGLIACATPSFAAMTSRSATTGPVNLIENSDFESGSTVGWRPNSPAERLSVTSPGYRGSYAARIVTTTKSNAVLNDDPNTVSSTVKGATYLAVAWVRTPNPKLNGELRLRQIVNGSQVDRAVTTFSLRDTAWHQVQLAYRATVAGASLDLNVLAWNVEPGEAFLVDDVSLITDAPTPAPVPTTTTPAPVPTTTTPAPVPTTTTPAPVPTTTTPAPACAVNAILVPSCGAWLGVAPNPLSGESWDQALLNFEAQTGRTAGIAHYYHRGTQLFPGTQEIARARESGHRRLLLENWRPENGNSWAQVAAGASDALIDAEAAYLKSHFTERFFLAIHGEPEDEVIQTAGSGYTAADFRAMFRHVIQRLRGDGVTNVVSVMDYTGNPKWGQMSWFGDMYPGNDVVDWLAEDPYVIGPEGGWYDSNFGQLVNRTFPGYNWPGFYSWAGKVAPGKPIMIAEWGVDDLTTDPSWKPAKFRDIAAHMSDYPLVKALVYWNSNTFNPVGTTRVDSSSGALTAYRDLGHLAALNPTVPTS